MLAIIRQSEVKSNRLTKALLRDCPLVDKFAHVGQRLRHFRKAAGISQKDFAAAIGIKPPSLSEIESWQSKFPAAITLLRAAEALGLDPTFLLTGNGTPMRLVGQLRQDELRLLLLYRDLPLDRQHDLEVEANRLHALAYPVRSRLNPYPKKTAKA